MSLKRAFFVFCLFVLFSCPNEINRFKHINENNIAVMLYQQYVFIKYSFLLPGIHNYKFHISDLHPPKMPVLFSNSAIKKILCESIL